MERMIDVPDAGEQVEEDENFIVGGGGNKDAIEWILPYHQECANKIPSYESLTPGKYGKLVLKTRSEIYEEFKQNAHEMIHRLSRVESSLLSSEYHWKKLLELISHIETQSMDRYKFQTFDGRYHDLLKSMASYNILKMGKSQSNEKTSSKQPSSSTSSQLVITSKNNGLADMSCSRRVNIVQQREVYDLETFDHLNDIFPNLKPKLSIPNSKKHWFVINQDNKKIEKLTNSKDIRSWIFMPSYNRSSCGLFYLNSIKNEKDYRQVIVVRSQEFNCYRDLIGGDFVILSLPDMIDMKKLMKLCSNSNEKRLNQYNYTVEDKTIGDYELKDDIGGVGFSRLTIQILSYHWNLEFVWMMDDNCHHFEKVENGQKIPCALEEVLLPIEQIVYDEDQRLEFFTQTLHGKYSRDNPQRLLKLEDPVKLFTPGKENIAMIGIRKDAYRYNSDLHYKPFLKSTTICSLFLLNVTRTFKEGVLFPCRRYQEDIEFEYLCDEKGLLCIKSQKYFLHKPSNPLRIEPETYKPSMYECDEDKVKRLLCNYMMSDPRPEPLSMSQEYISLRDAITENIREWSDPPEIEFDKLIRFVCENEMEFLLFLTSKYLIENNTEITAALNFLTRRHPQFKFEVSYYTPQNNENIQELIMRMVIRRK